MHTRNIGRQAAENSHHQRLQLQLAKMVDSWRLFLTHWQGEEAEKEIKMQK